MGEEWDEIKLEKTKLRKKTKIGKKAYQRTEERRADWFGDVFLVQRHEQIEIALLSVANHLAGVGLESEEGFRKKEKKKKTPNAK